MKQPALRLALIVTCTFAAAHPAQAINPVDLFTITIAPDGSGNVVANGTGEINLSALTYSSGEAIQTPKIEPGAAIVTLGNEEEPVVQWAGVSGLETFGPGSSTAASSTTGLFFSVVGAGGDFDISPSYVSNAPLTDSSTWDSTTISGLGLTPGTYTYTYGASSVVVDVASSPAVPEPSQYGLFVVLAAGAFLAWRRFSQRELSA